METNTTQDGARQYFLVGAMWSDGTDDQYERFMRLGIWESGWDPNHEKSRSIIENIKVKDRIAIKKGLGNKTSDMCIRAIGIVIGVDVNKGIVYVDWRVKGMNRKVHSRGCFSTIHGPFTKKQSSKIADWINQIFCLWFYVVKNPQHLLGIFFEHRIF